MVEVYTSDFLSKYCRDFDRKYYKIYIMNLSARTISVTSIISFLIRHESFTCHVLYINVVQTTFFKPLTRDYFYTLNLEPRHATENENIH